MKLIAELPDNYRSALEDDVPEGRACGNCIFFNEDRLSEDGEMAWCEQWEEFVSGGNYCDAWEAKEAESNKDDDEDEEEYSKSKVESSRPMILTFSQDVLTCNKSKREMSGVIVPFGKIGYTNMGEVMFEAGSLNIGEDIKLFTEHDMGQPIGRMIEHKVTPIGVIGKFKIANTHAGDDALVLASENLRGAFSIGAKINQSEPEDGVLKVKSAELIEVSHVSAPAFAEAQITDVAASADNQTQTEKEPEDMKPEETKEVQAAPEVAVEASKPAEVLTAAVAYAKPRVNTDVTAGQYAMAQIKAMQGDSDARDLVAALEIATVTENTGVVPPNYLREIIGIIDDSRPFINSIERAALPATGMKVFTPKLGAQATVAVTAEGAEFDSTDTAVTFQEDNIVKFAGANIINVELLDRSDPSFLDLLLRELAASYAQKTDAYAANIACESSPSSTGSTIYKAIAEGIADSYEEMRFTPNNLLVAPSGGASNIDFAGLLGAEDGNDRPLFAAAAPQNAGGLITQGSTNGTVAGLNLVVDPNYTGNNLGSKLALVYPSAAMRFHESGLLQLRTNVVANGRVEIGLYGYVAVVNKYPAAFRSLVVSP
jgi:HK97 family phage prohead protease